MKWPLNAGPLVALTLRTAAGLDLNINDRDSIISANNIACDNALAFYQGNEPGGIPGIIDLPYYWWEAGGLFGVLIQRWSTTGNDSLNDMVIQGLQNQVGEAKDFQPLNQTKDEGNDDQLYWAFAAMDAAELGFPNPPSGKPSWTALAQAVFNEQTNRWDNTTCGGGMRWQLTWFSEGYYYKNLMSNGGYFQLAARLARYTGNNTYVKYAERMYDWIAATPIFDNSTSPMRIWDGIHTANCSGPDMVDYTYNPANLLVGAAYMYNYTNGSSLWETRINDLLGATNIFFIQDAGTNNPPVLPKADGQILAEVSCEPWPVQTCNQDEPSFKAYTIRWLAITAQLAPFTNATIWPRLQASAQGAAAQCIGNAPNQHPGTSCGRRWYQSTWDSYSGLGEHMSAMSVFQSLLINDAKPPLTIHTGGISKSDPGAGAGGTNGPTLPDVYVKPITAGDKAGASILTIMGVALAMGAATWMII